MLAMIACALAANGAKHSFTYDATFVEGCSCKDVCVTEITGTDAACNGLAGVEFRHATYAGRSFSGTRAAWAWGPGWVRLYVDAKGPKRDVLVSFLTAALADWGKLEAVVDHAVSVKGSAGNYTVSVPALANLTLKPVYGRDGKTPVEHTNLVSLFHDRLFQGKIVQGRLNDAGHDTSWKDTNAFFNGQCKMTGKV